VASGAFIGNGGSGGMSLAAYDAAGVMRFYTGGLASSNERVRIDSTGNVGIGTTNPGKLLHIAGSDAGNADFVISDTSQGADLKNFSISNRNQTLQIGTQNDAISNFTAYLTMDRNGYLAAPAAHHAFGVSSALGYIGVRFTNSFTSNGGSNFVAGLDIDPTITLTTGDTNYANYVNVAGFGITTQASEAVGIVSSMRLAEPQITLGPGGTVTKASTLYIAGAPTEGATNAALYIENGNTLLGATSGSVGIGVTSPTYKLEAGGIVKLGDGASTPDQTSIVDIMDGSLTYALRVWDDNNLVTPRFAVKRTGESFFSTGSVGIGSTLPNSTLEVAGSFATALATKTTAYTVTASDSIIYADATSAGFIVTLPTAVGITGRQYTIKKIDSTANAVTVDPTGAETIDGAATYSLGTQWKYLTVVSNGANWGIIANN